MNICPVCSATPDCSRFDGLVHFTAFRCFEILFGCATHMASRLLDSRLDIVRHHGGTPKLRLMIFAVRNLWIWQVICVAIRVAQALMAGLLVKHWSTVAKAVSWKQCSNMLCFQIVLQRLI